MFNPSFQSYKKILSKFMTLMCQSFAKGIFNLEINEGTIVSIYLFILFH